MVPRVMHVAGGEKKEGEGFASCEAAAWKEGRFTKKKKQAGKIRKKSHFAASRDSRHWNHIVPAAPVNFQASGLTRRPNLSLFSTCGLILI